MSTTDTRSVRTEDGRQLQVVVTGPDDGRLLLVHLGTPSGAVDVPQLSRPAAERGLRTAFCARPGYAGSTPRPGRSVADVAEDTGAVLAALGSDRFVTVGWSGGGPHALACAALLPDRCAAAATIAGVAPYEADGIDWLAGMGPENVEEFDAAHTGAETLAAFLGPKVSELATVTGVDVAAALGGLVSPVDAAAATGDLADVLAASFRSAISTGIAGWLADDLAFVRPWGFELSSITVPVAVWQGGQDRMVPPTHGAWLAQRVPGARAHLDPDAGHLSLLDHADAVLDDLLRIAAW